MILDIPTRQFGGYIFDCDGTIADSMPVHYRAWSDAVTHMGGQFPEDLFYSWGGKPTPSIVEELNKLYNLSMDVEATVRMKEDAYLRNVSLVKPIAPVLEIARGLYGVKPLAIASGGHRELVMATLEALQIVDLFETIVCAEDYTRGKPFPDPFLLAAKNLGVAPEECIVFEDSPTGIEAAKAAGMHYVLVPSAPIPEPPV